MSAVTQMFGIGSPETIRTWIRRQQVDEGDRPGAMTDATVEIKRLKRENSELRRANARVKAASALLAAEPDRPHKRQSASSTNTRTPQ